MPRHQDRKDLAGEYRWGDLGQLIFLVIFLVVYISDSFFLSYSTFLNDSLSGYIRIPLACIIWLISLYFAKSGLGIVFGEKREKAVLIRTGVFSRVRHPIYLASILFYLSLLLFSVSLISAGVWVFIVCFYNFISKYEENLLVRKFGEEYEEYRKEVPMWIPRMFKQRS